MSLSTGLGLIGSYFFGPVGGFIGSTLGSLLDPADDVVNYGPRIEDRKVSTTGYGQSLPIVYGTMQLAAHIIEPADFELTETVQEDEQDDGKGGGPSVTNVTYTYSATFAAAICEGPIIGVRKIWLDSVLVYDFSDSATAEAIAASNQAATGIRIYLGDESQTADSILEGLNGAGNTSAYRGVAYIVFDALQLADYGNRVPNIRVEVVGSGSVNSAGRITHIVDHANPYTNHVVTYNDNGVFRVWDRQLGTTDVADTAHLIDLNGNYLGEDVYDPDVDIYPIKAGGGTRPVGTLGDHALYVKNIGQLPEPAGTFELGVYDYPPVTKVGYKALAPKLPQNRYVLGVMMSPGRQRLIVIMGDNIGTLPSAANTVGVWYMFDTDLDIVDSGTCDFTSAYIPSGVTYNYFGWGNFTESGDHAGMLESDYLHLFSASKATGSSGDIFWWQIDEAGELTNTYRLTGSASIADLDASAADGRGFSVYADDGVAIVVGEYKTDITKGYVDLYSREPLLTAGVANVSDILDDIQERAGITSANRDNSAITDTTDGYMIARQMPAKRAMEPLQTAFFFDNIESDYIIKAVPRGGASVVTIPSTELGAHDFGSAPVYPLEKTRQQEIEIPVEVVCKYISPGRGYDPATQRSRRINTQSREKKTIDLPVSLTDDAAKQIAEVLHFNYWSERNTYDFSLMPEYAYLDPSDVITVTHEGATHIIRIVSMDMIPGGVIQCKGVTERAAVYSSTSTGADNSSPAVTVGLVGPTKAVYGDWPAFTNDEDDQKFYVAALGYLDGWNGAQIFKSIDASASFFNVSTLVQAGTVGYTTDALPDGPVSTFDYGSTVNVRLLGSGTLSSSTKLAVLNGANPMMIGSELIQFVNATLEADGSYTLDTLLRGRKGTEWATGTHASKDQAVFINTNLRRVPATIGVERQYKAVSIGNFAADTFADNFTYSGINKKPYAPAHIKGARNSSNDLAVSWVNRSRLVSAPLWSPPLGEDSEEYEIDIYDAGFTTILRAVTGLSSPSYNYTAALQTTDFGSPQASINMKIYQKSATVGRGYAGAATL